MSPTTKVVLCFPERHWCKVRRDVLGQPSPVSSVGVDQSAVATGAKCQLPGVWSRGHWSLKVCVQDVSRVGC